MTPEEYAVGLVERCKEAKKLQGISNQEIADKTIQSGHSVSVPTIARVLSPKAKGLTVKIKTVIAIADALDVPHRWDDEINFHQLEICQEEKRKLREDLNRTMEKLESAERMIKTLEDQVTSMRKSIREFEAAIKSKDKIISEQMKLIHSLMEKQ